MSEKLLDRHWRMNSIDIGDLLTLPLAPPAGTKVLLVQKSTVSL